MKRYTVTRNGYDVKFFSNFDEVEAFIFGVLEEHKNLNPKEIFRHYGSDTTDGEVCKDTIKSVIIFQYYTMYTEVFMIEEETI